MASYSLHLLRKLNYSSIMDEEPVEAAGPDSDTESVTSCNTESTFNDHVSQMTRDTRRHLYGVDGQASKEITLNQLKEFLFILHNSWSNILGPQIIKVWKGKRFASVKEEIFLINYVNRHVLIGDLSFDKVKQCRKLIVLPGQKIMIYSQTFVTTEATQFGAKEKSNSLSFVFPYYFNSVINSNRIVNILPFLDGLTCKILSHVTSCPNIMSGSLANLDNDVHYLLSNKFDLISCDQIRSLCSEVKGEFLKRCFQGVLQCGGYGVLFGHKSEIKSMQYILHCLVQVLPRRDRCCTLKPILNNNNFLSFVYLQCLTNDPKGDIDRCVRQKSIDNRFPIALIDVNNRIVNYSSSLEEFVKKKFFSSTKHPVTQCSKLVHELVENTLKFRTRKGFLERLGHSVLEQIRYNADLFTDIYLSNALAEPITIANQLKWEQSESDIYIAWAYRKNVSVRKNLYAKR